MSVIKEDDKSQLFTMSMFGSKEDLCKAKLEWDIKKAAVLAERERCAMVCEDMDDKHMSEAIRRGK